MSNVPDVFAKLPLICKVLLGAVVPIPTFPPVVKILPMVLLLNVAWRPPDIDIEPTVRLPLKTILPSVTARCAGEIKIVDLLAGNAMALVIM